MSIKPRFGFALEYVPDVDAAKQFYVDVLGLEVQRYHPTFVQFETFALASDQSIGGDREPELYWLIEDAQAAFDKVFSIKDPAGRPRYLLELAKDRPSRAV